MAEIRIDTFEVIEGTLPRRVMGLVLEWAAIHRNELRENWVRARAHEQILTIDLLE